MDAARVSDIKGDVGATLGDFGCKAQLVFIIQCLDRLLSSFSSNRYTSGDGRSRGINLRM